MMFWRRPVDYALVGERDGWAGRPPQAALARKLAYRQGYAAGQQARAARMNDEPNQGSGMPTRRKESA
uniref:Uncharacterized protein n=1 Tax=mine drainage metagenome TaxID=410659 RepID=E6PP50_9ZZZZ